MDQVGLSKRTCLVSFKIPIMFLMGGGHCCKDFCGLLVLNKICQSFKHYLLNNYGTVKNITVTFDGGYLVPSKMGSKHNRQSKGRLGRKVAPSFHNPLIGDFLLRKHKQTFLEMLGVQLSASCSSIMHSDGDADVDVVSSALTVANTCPVTLLGKDTDLLILLLWHCNLSLHHPVHLCFNSSNTTLDIYKSKQLFSDELTQILQHIPFVADCILLDHVQYYKHFWEIKNSEIYWGSIH